MNIMLSLILSVLLTLPFTAANPQEGGYAIQVEATQDRSIAEQKVQQLKEQGLEAYWVKGSVPGKGVYYRVRIGQFPNKEAAMNFGASLKRQGIAPDFLLVTYQAPDPAIEARPSQPTRQGKKDNGSPGENIRTQAQPSGIPADKSSVDDRANKASPAVSQPSIIAPIQPNPSQDKSGKEVLGRTSVDPTALIIEALWNGDGYGIMLGNVKFKSDSPFESHGTANAAKGIENYQELPIYEAFAREGIISMTQRDLSKDSSFGSFFELSQNGIRKTAQISLTEKGRASGTIQKFGETSVLTLRPVTYKVSRIVADDSVNTVAYKLRIAQGVQDIQIPEFLRVAWAKVYGYSAGERKFKVLLKFDPFDKKWKVFVDGSRAVQDFAAVNAEFNTHNVDQVLFMLGQQKARPHN
jgi:hypothetical protein